MPKSSRKSLEDIWEGDDLSGIGNIVRFAPSACNMQPWFVRNENDTVKVYRYISPIRKWIMPIDGVLHFNHIDIGIFLCFLELCLLDKGIPFERKLFIDDKNKRYNLVAEYKVG